MLISPAYAQSASGGGAIFEMLFPLIMVFAIIYFMILRPQARRQKEHTAMIEAVRRNDTVVTQGGLIGKVAKVGDDELEVDEPLARRHADAHRERQHTTLLPELHAMLMPKVDVCRVRTQVGVHAQLVLARRQALRCGTE